jgi:hypothetical protein
MRGGRSPRVCLIVVVEVGSGLLRIITNPGIPGISVCFVGIEFHFNNYNLDKTN